MNNTLSRANMLLQANQIQIGESIFIEPYQMEIDWRGNMYVKANIVGSQYPTTGRGTLSFLVLTRNESGYFIDLKNAKQYEWLITVTPKEYRSQDQELALQRNYIKIDGIVENVS